MKYVNFFLLWPHAVYFSYLNEISAENAIFQIFTILWKVIVVKAQDLCSKKFA